jgi:uncharacterized protein with NRDE domain
MCLIFLSVNNHPDYKLIVAGNRDEFYKRKTQSAHFWTDQPHLLAGKDLEAGGTWMGITKNGKLSFVTNYRDLRNLKPVAPSRGHLVSDFLVNGDQPQPYLESVATRGNQYNGFNLVVGTPDELYYYSNYRNAIEQIPEGIHGLSNHLLNTPWPKVKRGIENFQTVLKKPNFTPDDFFEFLYDHEQAPDDQLPDTGIGLERERVLSSMFIKSPDYGSRCSTLILVDRKNQVLFAEREYNTETFTHTTRKHEFKIK